MNNRYLTPNVIYCSNIGHLNSYEYPDSRPSNSYFELNDSTLIPFNEHSTFEDRLDLDEIGFEIDTGHYRVLYIDDEYGVLDEGRIYFSANKDENYFYLSFAFIKCFLDESEQFLHFTVGNNELVSDYCRNIDSLIITINNSVNKYEITGITSDRISAETANLRVAVVYDSLIRSGIAADRLIKNYTSISETSLGYEKYYELYPPEDFISRDNVESIAGIRVKEYQKND
ncbi:MAG: hypothetical protein GQ574_12775 [Crocinitomix sp.]|nr:hypothetical protein [Crocinitomix sp.]